MDLFIVSLLLSIAAGRDDLCDLTDLKPLPELVTVIGSVSADRVEIDGNE